MKNVLILLAVTALMLQTEGFTKDEAVQRATELLIQEKNASPTDIEIDEVVSTEFRNASLGCPEKGMSYAQVIVPGYVVSVRTGRSVHRVHVSADRAVLCDSSAEPSKRRTRDGRAAALDLAAKARKHLAAHLDVSEATIRLHSVKPATWSSTSLGCPREGEEYESREIAGHRIEWVHDGKIYTYHAGDDAVVLCSERTMESRQGE